MSRRLMQFVVAMWAAASLMMSPVVAQAQQLIAQETQGQKLPPEPVTTAPPRNVNLFTGQPDYSKGNSWFPNLIKPYESMSIPQPDLANSPRLDQLIANGKLMLSLQDAISLALDNNLDIAVQRYTPWIGETGILGANGRFDPALTASGSIQTSTTQFNNVFQGSGALSMTQHSTAVDVGYSQLFHTGTNMTVTWNNTRLSSNLSSSQFNPEVNTFLQASITQPLLNGFGIVPNTYQIIEAKNTAKADQAAFKQSVINDVTNTALAYWALVYARENITVQEKAVAAAQQLYDNTSKEYTIGTVASADVVNAQAESASSQQALVVAQTTKLQSETALLSYITKNPLAGTLADVEIIPTTPITEPPVTENMPIEDAVHEAWKNSPVLQQAQLSLANAKVTEEVAKNALLPKLDLSAIYSGTGLRGVQTLPSGVVVDNGLGNALSDVFHNESPTYEGQLTLSLPLRNRAAQANNASAVLTERQQQVSYQEAENNIFVSVRSAMIALKQDRAALASASQSVKYQQIAYDNIEKEFNLGTATSFAVVQQVQLLTQYQGQQLQAEISLADAEWTFNQAMGRTLDVNHIIIAGAQPNRTRTAPQVRNASANQPSPASSGTGGR